MYAVVETGGKQLIVKPGDEIYVEKLAVNEGDKVVLDKVVFINDAETKIGNPYVENAKVNCSVVKQGKQKKVIIFKYKAKKKSTRRKMGHRQPYTKLIVDSIEG